MSPFPIHYPCLSLAQVVFSRSKRLQILWKKKQIWESTRQQKFLPLYTEQLLRALLQFVTSTNLCNHFTECYALDVCASRWKREGDRQF